MQGVQQDEVSADEVYTLVVAAAAWVFITVSIAVVAAMELC